MRFSAAAVAAVALLAACTTSPRTTVIPRPSTTGPVYFGGKPVRFELESRPLGFDADGNAEWLVVARFLDAHGQVTRIMANSDLDWTSRTGRVQWQNRMRFGQPSAIVKTNHDGRMTLVVRCNMPALGTRVISTDTREWKFPRVVGDALGAYTARIAWFPRADRSVRITRLNCLIHGRRQAWILSGKSSFQDPLVSREQSCLYAVAFLKKTYTVSVTLPRPPPDMGPDNILGTGMWLYFTTNPLDSIYYGNLNPEAIVDRAVRAHLHYVELRTAYGAFWQITPEARPTIDAIIDGLAAHHIVTIGWTVPRDDAFDDLQASVQTAYYRTAHGTPLGGIAVDLERGDEFMGGSPDGLDALWKYMRAMRDAIGLHHLLVATVEDPYLEGLTEQSYPYAQIAKYSEVLQPMTYARMLRHKPLNAVQTAAIVRNSYSKLRDLTAQSTVFSARDLPISMGAQTNAIGAGGAPSPSEITAAMKAARDAGAIGTCFFAWDGTSRAQWEALGLQGVILR